MADADKIETALAIAQRALSLMPIDAQLLWKHSRQRPKFENSKFENIKSETTQILAELLAFLWNNFKCTPTESEGDLFREQLDNRCEMPPLTEIDRYRDLPESLIAITIVRRLLHDDGLIFDLPQALSMTSKVSYVLSCIGPTLSRATSK